MIGAPVRNRGWILGRHLEALIAQEGMEKEFCYIVNDCTDNTEAVLQKYGANYAVRNLASKATEGHVRGKYSVRNLAIVRNYLLEEFLKSDCDYLFSIDTDIIIPPNSLQQLLTDGKDIIAMLIKNHPTLKAYNVMRNGKHFHPVEEGIIEIDLTGAVYLISRQVIEAGVRYGDSQFGEDHTFCEKAKEHGYKLYCDSRIKAIHAYAEEVDLLP